MEAGNAYYSTADGVLFADEGETLVRYPTGKSGSYTVAGIVTYLEPGAFAYCTGLTGLTIETQESEYPGAFCLDIGAGAFKGCTGLTGLTLPIRVREINESAFEGLTGLTSVTFETRDPETAGWEQPLFINDRVFKGCTGLTELILPKGNTYIGYEAFSGCSGLKRVEFEMLRAPYIEADAFTGVTAKCIHPDDGEWTDSDRKNYGGTLTWGAVKNGTIDTLSWEVDETGVLTVTGTGTLPDYSTGAAPWAGCFDEITRIELGKGVVNKYTLGFNECANLTAVTGWCGENLQWELTAAKVLTVSGTGAMTDYSETGNVAPWGVSYGPMVETVIVEEGVTTVGDNGFHFTYAKTVSLPSTLTSIGDYAFHNVLGGLNTVVIPENVTSIGTYAFYVAERLKNVVFTGDAPTIGENAFCNQTVNAFYPKNADGWTDEVLTDWGGTMRWHAVEDWGTCGEEMYWAYGDSYLYLFGTGTMDDYSGSESAPWSDHAADIRVLEVMEGTASMGANAFLGCTALKDVIFHDVTPAMDEAAFTGVTANVWCITDDNRWTEEAQIGYGGTLTWTDLFHQGSYTESNVRFAYDRYGAVVFYGHGPMIDNVNLNGLYDYIIDSAYILPGVTHIGASAFSSTYDFFTISIADTVTSIGRNAFNDNDDLETIVIPSSVTTIGDGAFYHCGKLRSVTFEGATPGLLTVGASAFSNCEYLTSINLPDSVTSIGGEAFCNCTRLTTLDMPSALKTIGNNAFEYVPLTEVTLPEGMQTIGAYAFNDCRSLTKITLPDSITDIGESAFAWCTKLASLDLPANLKSVKANILKNNSKVEQLTLPDGLTTLEDDAFVGANLFRIWVPDSVTSIGATAFNVNSWPLTIWYEGTQEQWDRISSGSAYLPSGTTVHVNAGKDAPAISVQPVNVSAAVGETANISLTATGTGLTYQWQYSTNGINWVDCTGSGCRSATLPVPMTADLDGRWYRCIVSGLFGEPVTSNVVTLTLPKPLAIITQPADQSAAKGGKVSFTVAAEGGHGTLTYNWQWKGTGDWNETTLSGHDTPTLTVSVSDSTNGRQYHCIITDGDGCTLTSAPATLYQGITRAGLAELVHKTLMPDVTDAPAVGFTDIANCTAAQKTAIYALVEAGIIRGTSAGTFEPNGIVSRGSAAIVACRAGSGNTTADLAAAIAYLNGLGVLAQGETDVSTFDSGAVVTAEELTKWLKAIKREQSLLDAPVLTEAFNSSTGVRVSWKAVEGAESYRLLRKNLTKGETEWSSVGETTECSLIDKSAASASRYTFTVECIDADGNTVSKRDETGRTCTYIAMAKITSVTSTDEGLKVEWQKPGGAKNFRVMRKVDGGSTWTVLTTAQITSYLDTNVEPGVKYWYTVRAMNLAGDMYINSYNSYGWSGRWEGAPQEEPLTVTGQPASQTVAAGTKASFTVAAEGGSGTLTYQWQYSTNGTSWSNTTLSGYNTPTLTVTASTTVNGRQYRCIVTDGSGNKVESAPAKLTLKTAAELKITAQPEAQSATAGEKVQFTVAASGGSGTLTYQWQYSTNGTSWSNTTLSGYNTPTLTVTASTTVNGRQYRCIVTDGSGNKVESNGAKLTLKTAVELKITGQPASQTVAAGEKASFTVAAEGGSGTLTYQWQWKGTASTSTWANTTLSGYNTDTLTVAASTTTNGRQYRCIVTDSSGNKVESDAAKLTLKTAAELKITGQPASQTVEEGEKVKFTVTASGGSGTLTYQWQWKGTASTSTWANTTLTGATTDTLAVTATASMNGRQYRCIVTDSSGNKVESNGAKLTVTAAPTTQYSGTCGDDLRWTLDSNGTLTISGTGTMDNYDDYSSTAPWYDYRADIRKLVINSGATSIGWDAFGGCTGLTEVTVPATVKNIYGCAFSGCTGLTEVTIEGALDFLGYAAFSGCRELTTLSMGGNIGFDGTSYEVFLNCDKLSTLHLGPNVTEYGGVVTRIPDLVAYTVDADNWKYSAEDGVLFSKTGQTLIDCPEGKTGTFVIPDGVETIGGGAFMNSVLTDVYIPNTVTEIERSAFANAKLTEIYIPSSVQTIGQEAFAYSSLTEVDLPNSVTSLGQYAFEYCEDLTGVSLSTGMTAVDQFTFRGCTALEWVEIPTTVTEILHYAFLNCTSLRSTGLPDSVTYIGAYAYSGCDSLYEVTLPHGLETLNSYAFYGCEGLRSVTIPSTVKTIHNNAFYQCTALEEVYIAEGVTTIYGSAFAGCESLITITVPESVTEIGSGAFSDSHLEHLYYPGDEEAWANVTGSDDLPDITRVHCNSDGPIYIVDHPEDQTASAGERVSFTVSAVQGCGELSYQWQYSANGGRSWSNTTLTGYNTDTLSLTATAAINGRQYRCVITDECGDGAISHPAILTVE